MLRIYLILPAVCVGLQMIEAVKKEMAQLDLMAGRLSEQEYDSQKRVLLMQLYRATGPAKVKAACELIESALNQGTFRPKPRTRHACCHLNGVLPTIFMLSSAPSAFCLPFRAVLLLFCDPPDTRCSRSFLPGCPSEQIACGKICMCCILSGISLA